MYVLRVNAHPKVAAFVVCTRTRAFSGGMGKREHAHALVGSCGTNTKLSIVLSMTFGGWHKP